MTNIPSSGASLRGAVDLSSLVRPPATGRESIQVPSLVVDGTDANFTGILDLSNTVPVVVELYATQPSAVLSKLVAERAGSLVLARVDATSNRQLVQAFQAERLPTVAAVIAGRPISLYVGEIPESDVRQVFDQLLALAAQNGVTGTVAADPDADSSVDSEPAPEPLPPHHQEAYDAIAVGDYARAIKAYQDALAQNPRDGLAVAGLAQVQLLARLSQRPADEVRAAAVEFPGDVEAQLAAADLELSDGRIAEAFDRLLSLFPTLPPVDKDRVRTRLLDFFEIVGSEDERVVAARRRLTNLLY